MKNIKKRYSQAIKKPAEVKEVIGQGGRKVTIRTTYREMTLEEMEKERLAELKEMGFDLKKLREAGFDPDRDNPDDFCDEDFGCEGDY